MRYGFGQAFILSERRTNGVKLNNLNWVATGTTALNETLTSAHPWGKKLLQKQCTSVFTQSDSPIFKRNTNLVHTPFMNTTVERAKLAYMGEAFKSELGNSLKAKSRLGSSDYLRVLNHDKLTPTSLEKSFKEYQVELEKEVDPEHQGVRSMTLSPMSDISFLRKEFTYTKLKYSRSPQYDAVSGGFAALLAAFIGFLISEKFGIELVDSGDFFIGFMYALFIGFTGRLLIVLSSDKHSPHFSISPRHNLTFFKEICLFFLKKLTLK